MSGGDFALKMKDRTKSFALSVLRELEDFEKGATEGILKKQVVRSASAVGANYRSACRARSMIDFIAKMKIVVEEADESQYWLELLFELGLLKKDRFEILHNEAHQLVSIFVKSIQTAQSNLK